MSWLTLVGKLNCLDDAVGGFAYSVWRGHLIRVKVRYDSCLLMSSSLLLTIVKAPPCANGFAVMRCNLQLLTCKTCFLHKSFFIVSTSKI